MEESKDLQTLYKVFRTFIYVSLIVEFFEYAINPDVLDHWGGILVEIHDRLKLLDVYQNGHLLHSKVMTLLIICITCIGTRNKKHLEFNAKKMVIYPISIGIVLMFLSVWVFTNIGHPISSPYIAAHGCTSSCQLLVLSFVKSLSITYQNI